MSAEAASANARGRRVEVLFDLDDTLYPASAGLFRLVSQRIREFIQQALGVSEEEARHMQRSYWRQYGTSLYGLMREHDVAPEPFLRYVHDVPIDEYLKPDPAGRSHLESLPARRHVFTNGPAEFAERVLEALGYRDLFERIFDIRHAGYVPKPNPEPYDAVVGRLDPGGLCVLVEDALKNLPPARQRGWRTVWLRQPDSVLGGSRGLSMAEAPDFTPDATIDELAEMAGAWPQIVGQAPADGG